MTTLPHTINTARLELHSLGPDDAADLSASWARSRSHLAGHVTVIDDAMIPSYLERVAMAFREGAFHMFAIRTHAGQFVGALGLGRGELSYWIDVAHTRRGYATEASGELLRAAFRAGARTIKIRCREDNAGSIQVAKRLGFSPESRADGVLVFAVSAIPDQVRVLEIADAAGKLEVVDEAIRLRTLYGFVDLRVGQAPMGAVAIASADVCAEDDLAPRDLLAHNSTLAVGAVCTAGGRVQLRLVAAIDALRPEALVMLAQEAQRLARHARRPEIVAASNPFAHYA
jgi:RimJ/RimL family protein N-acetyltransferase